jgi:hypothetical protein
MRVWAGIREAEAVVAIRPEGNSRVAAPSDWQGWQRWVEGVDWSDWRGWLKRLASRDWSPGHEIGQPLPRRADAATITAACLRSPLYASHFHDGSGTLYTAEYQAAEGTARYHWPDRTWEHSLDKIGPKRVQVHLPSRSAGLPDTDGMHRRPAR